MWVIQYIGEYAYLLSPRKNGTERSDARTNYFILGKLDTSKNIMDVQAVATSVTTVLGGSFQVIK